MVPEHINIKRGLHLVLGCLLCGIVPCKIFAVQSTYVLYSQPLFQFITPTYIPTTSDYIQKLSVVAAQNQYQSANFAMYTVNDVNNLTMTLSDLQTYDNHVLSKQNIDLRIVKIWPSVRYTGTTAPPVTITQVPELLVYDDTQVLKGTFQNPHDTSGNSYIPPNISLQFHTNVPANTSKQFWLTVHIPPQTAVGLYKGIISIKSDTRAVVELPIEVTVLPFTLLESQKDFSMYYDGIYQPSVFVRTTDYLNKELADLKAHGINGLRILKLSTDSLDTTVSQIKTNDLKGPIIVVDGDKNYYASDSAVLRKYGYQPLFYGIDEPNTSTKAAQHIRRSFDVHEHGGKVLVAINKDQSDRLSNPDDPIYNLLDPTTYTPPDLSTAKSFRFEGIIHEPVDIPNYNVANMTYNTAVDSLRTYITNLQHNTLAKDPRKEYYYWQIWYDNPEVTRMLSGYFLWNSHLDGIMPWVYYRLSLLPRDPTTPEKVYAVDPFTEAGIPSLHYLQTMTTYPSQQGPIPTVRWEGLREGINDIRHVTTLEDLITQLKSQNPSLATTLQQSLDVELQKYLVPHDQKIGSITGSNYDESRNTIIHLILQAQYALSTAKKGDADGNGKVDGYDYIVWLNNYNTKTLFLAQGGDFNGDGTVDGLDFMLWRLNYSQ